MESPKKTLDRKTSIFKENQTILLIYASINKRVKHKGRRADALAPGAEERRDKLR